MLQRQPAAFVLGTAAFLMCTQRTILEPPPRQRSRPLVAQLSNLLYPRICCLCLLNLLNGLQENCVRTAHDLAVVRRWQECTGTQGVVLNGVTEWANRFAAGH